MKPVHQYEAVVIGVSAGGLTALRRLLRVFPASFSYPVIIVQHLSASSDNTWISILDKESSLRIKEADEKEPVEKGTVYVAPPNYHLLVERDKTLSLTIDERVKHARPSINVLFETAAEAYKDRLIGIILTGSTDDGTNGMKKIKEMGGMTIAQDPATAESGFMPAAAIARGVVDHILPLEGISELLIKINSLETTK